MSRADYDSVCESMRLADGTLWPMPITLDVTPELAARLRPGERLALRDPEGVMLAVLDVEEVWEPDRERRGRGGLRHRQPRPSRRSPPPRAQERLGGGRRARRSSAAGALRLPAAAPHPAPSCATSSRAAAGGRSSPSRPATRMHRAHLELTLRAAREDEANLLIHPVVGMTKPGDVDHYTRVRCYQALLPPLSRRTPPCSRSCRSPCAWAARARPSGTPSSARTTAARTSSSAATTPAPARTAAASRSTAPTTPRSSCRSTRRSSASKMVPFKQMVYVRGPRTATARSTRCPAGKQTLDISGTELRRRLARGARDPATGSPSRRWWRSCAAPTRRAPSRASPSSSPASRAPASRRSPTCCWSKLLEMGGRPVTLLDGDLVRKNLSSELGFSQGAPRHQHPPHRLRGVGDHQERRHRHLRADRALRRRAQGRARDDRARRRLHPGPRRHRARGVRAARPQGPLRQGARRHRSRSSPASPTPTRRRPTPRSPSTPAELSPEEAAQEILLHLEREGFVGERDGG